MFLKPRTHPLRTFTARAYVFLHEQNIWREESQLGLHLF